MSNESSSDERSFLSPLERALVESSSRLAHYVPQGVTPNNITMVAIFFGLFSALSFYLAGLDRLWFLGAIAGMLFHTLLDYLDGAVARERGLTSKAGEFLDFFSDIVVMVSIFICVGFSSYASLAVMAFVAIVYPMHSVVILFWTKSKRKWINPRFADCEVVVSFVLLSIATFILNGKPVSIAGFSVSVFDLTCGVLVTFSFLELFFLAFKLFKQLSDEDREAQK